MKTYFLAFVFVVLSVSASSQMYSTRLWEVSHPNLKYKSYLVGTVHSGDETLFNINDSIYWAIEQCDLVAFEIVEEENDNIYSGLMSKIAAANRDIGFLTMECVMDVLPKFESTPIDTLVARYVSGIQKLYGTDIRSAKGSAYRSMVFDDFLTSYAHFKGKDVDGIEKVEDQVKALYTFTKPQMQTVIEGHLGMKENLLNSIPDDTIVRMAAENRYAEMCNMYSSFSQDPIWGSYFIKLLDNRNVQMADYVKKHSKEEPMMCAVGLGHMCGPMGVISLLQKEGYVIRPINIYTKYSRKEALKWHDYENDDFKTVLPFGVDSVIKRYYYGGALGGFLSGQNAKNKNVLMTPQGAIWFEYQSGSYYYDDEEDLPYNDGEEKSDFEKSLENYIHGSDNNDEVITYTVEAAVEAAPDSTEEEEGIVEDIQNKDGKIITDSLVNTVIDSVLQTTFGQEDSLNYQEDKVYPSRFVEFWSKVSESKSDNIFGSLFDTDSTETEPIVDTISLGEGLGSYTATYGNDVIFEYELPGEDNIKLRIRGDENAMKRSDILDYFKKAALRERE